MIRISKLVMLFSCGALLAFFTICPAHLAQGRQIKALQTDILAQKRQIEKLQPAVLKIQAREKTLLTLMTARKN